VCSTALARRSWPAFGRTTGASDPCRVLIRGLAAVAVGAALFVVIHSPLIAPIWTRFAGHLPFALIAGVGLAFAFASGAAAGAAITRRQRGSLAFAAATLALAIAMGGTIPVVNSPRAALLFVGFLPNSVGSGVALSVARRCRTPSET
jgi:hypothetical protein